MKNATLLVLLGKASDPAKLAGLADLARDRRMHLTLLLLGRSLPIPTYTYAMGDYGAFAVDQAWVAATEEDKALMHAAIERFEAYLTAENLEGNVVSVFADPTTLPMTVAQHALTCDLVLAANDLREDADIFAPVVRAALFESPTGVLLNAGTTASLTPRRVLIAWNAGLPAARAVHAALPLLIAADEVELTLVDPVTTDAREGDLPGEDLARWLSHKGCNVSIQQWSGGGREVGESLLQHARETGADLIVMGAYDHSRMRQVIFGGTTRSMMEQTEMAVLMAH